MIFWKRFFQKNSSEIPIIEGKIEIFCRHCLFSTISQHKNRFPRYSRQACYQNLIETVDREKANLTFILDLGGSGKRIDHFLPSTEKVIEIREGSESGSFLRLLEYVISLNLPPETILYFVEDDYLHRPGWMEVLKEGFTIPHIDYVTLYDHKDKYFSPSYQRLQSKIFATQSSHWRSTPSTTQTFAVKYKTLLRDLSIHRKYSSKGKISQDHQKFCHLNKKGAMLISSIPGWSTHCEPQFASPGFEWEELFKER